MVQTAVRFALVWALFACVSPLVCLVLIFLLPARVLRIRWLNFCGAWLAPLVLWLLGVRVQRGQASDDMYSGPAVYVANHSSALDTILVPWYGLLSATFVAKKEAKYIPILGQLLWLSGHVFIDRSSPIRAVHSLDELAAFAKQNQLSIWIMPEGTRSKDGRLGRFKSGFAHLAMRTGFPVVPVAIHGASTVWPNGTWTLRRGEVLIRTLPWISTDNWTDDSVREQVKRVRQLIETDLAETPDPSYF